MSGISFEGIGEVAATFAIAGAVEAGYVVKVSGNGVVSPCTAGDKFCGVALAVKNGLATVQLGGLLGVKTTGSLTAGWGELAADGAGGVKLQAGGGTYLVVSAESGSAVVRL